MRTEKYDVAIVGGGPAGSNAARMAKQYNPDLDVVVFERGSEPAANCAGGLGLPFMKHLGTRPPEEIVQSPIHEVTIASPNEEISLGIDDVQDVTLEWLDGELEEMGWIVDRQAWDNWQLRKAEENGVDVRRKHVVESVENKKNSALIVKDRKENEKFEVEANYIGIATGANWDLAVDAGFDKDVVVPPKSEQHMGRQYHMKDPEYFENYGWANIYLLFDRRYAPEGYVWSFPEGKEYTRWGNGVPLSNETSGPAALDRFLKDKGKYEYTETARENTMAIIPTAKPLDQVIKGNVGLIGDTGHHCDPVHGGGMMFGARAGKWFAKAASEGDLSVYDKYWREDFLDTLQHRFIIRDLLYSMDNDEYDRFVKALQGFEITGLNPDYQIPRLLWHALKNDRGIFTKSAAEATKSFVKQKLDI